MSRATAKIAKLISELTSDIDRCKRRWHPEADQCWKCAEWRSSVEYLQSLLGQRRQEVA